VEACGQERSLLGDPALLGKGLTTTIPATSHGFHLCLRSGAGAREGEDREGEVPVNRRGRRKELAEAWTCTPRPGKPTAKQREPGVIEITAEMKEGEALAFLYMLLCHLGHVINC